MWWCPQGPCWDWANFYSGLVSNMVATLIGVAAGIPLGLWFNRRVERRQAKEQRHRTARQQLSVLRALRGELRHNRALLDQMANEFAASIGNVQFYNLDTDLWPAATTQLIQAIRDPNLVDLISQLYHSLEHMRRKIDARLDIYANPVAAAINEVMQERLATLAQSLAVNIPSTQERIDLILATLDPELARIETEVQALSS